MSIWVPPSVSAELRASRMQHEAELLEQVHRKGVMDDFNRELRGIDPYLELIWAPENAHAAGLVPGRWHILRRNPGAPPSLMAITGPTGEYMEPNSSVFDMLRRNDLWNSEAVRDRKRMQRQAEEAADRRRARERAERQEELEERVKAARETSISMAQTRRPWRQSLHRGA